MLVADTLNNRVVMLPFTAGALSAATQVLGQDNFAMSAPNMIEGREFEFFPNVSGSAADAGVAIDTSAAAAAPHLYVSDPNNHRVLGFRDFRSLAAGARADIVIGQVDFNSGLCNMTGNPAVPTSSSLCYPTGLAVDPTGNLYVADSANSRVLRFPAPFAYQGTGPEPADLVLGQRQFMFSIPDPTSSTMKYPYGLALSDNNGLFVSDHLLQPGAVLSLRRRQRHVRHHRYRDAGHQGIRPAGFQQHRLRQRCQPVQLAPSHLGG